MNSSSLEEVKKITKGDEILMDMAKEIEEFLYGKKAMDLFGDRKRYEKMYLEQGRNEGINQTQEETVRRMLKNNLPIEDIVKYTGLSLEQVKKFQ